MKLYYFPGACSMASHIVVEELGLPVEPVLVDLATHRTASGDDYRAINPEGYVPALAFDDGTVMTESAAILQYLADTAGPNALLPAVGDRARYGVVEVLSFISTELHQKLGPLMDPTITEPAKAAVHARIHARLGRLERLLADSPHLTGADFTIADAYAFAILGAVRHFGVPLGEFPHIGAYLGRVGSRPSVVTVMRAEGLLP